MMERERRQQGYSRRVSQHDNLEVSRSNHEEFRKGIFCSKRDSCPVSTLTADPAFFEVPSEDSTTSAARIDAAIEAALASDSMRGVDTFYQPHPPGSASSMLGFPPDPHGDWREGGGGVLAVIQDPGTASMVYPPPRTAGDPWSRENGGGGVEHRPHHWPTTASPRRGIPSRTRRYEILALPPAKDSLGSANAGRRSGSVGESDSSGNADTNSGGGGGGVGGMRTYGDGHKRHGGGGGSGSGGAQQPTRSAWMRGGGLDTPRAVWQVEPPVALGAVVPMSGGSAEGFSSVGSSAEVGRSERSRHQSQSDHDYERHNAGSTGALGPPAASDLDMPPVDTTGGGTGGPAIRYGEGGGGQEVTLTPPGYDEPLELPDGCHHISLTKFLEVMTGPGLRVRKHHRTGKGSSGLRVLRYSEEGDNLTWDSHKILGAAQHVLPMSDVENVSMQARNRVVLLCVGGKDSYAVFEAANEDAAAVLFVGGSVKAVRKKKRRTSKGWIW
ncbi:unnamed protein product [Pylaiella littoralis]